MIKIYAGLLLLSGIAEMVMLGKFKKGSDRSSKDITLYFIIVPYITLTVVPILKTNHIEYSPATINLLLFVTMFIFGSSLKMIAIYQLSDNYSYKVEIKNNHVLVNHGLYKYIRHPLYLGNILICLACCMYYFSIEMAALFILMLLGTILRINKEEKHLKENLNGYDNYCKSSKRIIPFIY